MNFILLLAVIFSINKVGAQTDSPKYPDIVAGLSASGHFSVFLDLLTSSGLLPKINASSHFTVFAPTDDAFSKLPPDAFEALKNDPAKLADVIGYHVVLSTSLKVGSQQDTVLRSSVDKPIRINSYSLLHTVTADGVNITYKNIAINHGYVQGVDSVLTPPVGSIVQIGLNRTDISTFLSLIVKADLVHFFLNDDDVTIFVPNDAAFAKLSPEALNYLSNHIPDLIETLKYHVVNAMTLFSIGMKHTLSLESGDSHDDPVMIFEDGQGGLFVNHAKIVEKDISATDGVIHIIDNVLIPARVLANMDAQSVIVG